MNKEQSIKVLIEVAMMAQKAGILSLQDAITVAGAVSVLSAPAPQETVKPETTKKKK